MIREFKRHILHYCVLLFLLIIHAIGFIRFWPNRTAQEIMAISLGITYFLWGFAHHLLTHTLHKRNMLEYFFVSVFASSLLLMLIH